MGPARRDAPAWQNKINQHLMVFGRPFAASEHALLEALTYFKAWFLVATDYTATMAVGFGAGLVRLLAAVEACIGSMCSWHTLIGSLSSGVSQLQFSLARHSLEPPCACLALEPS